MMLRAPKGVTNKAGANAYATKLAISPTITVEMRNPSDLNPNSLSNYEELI